MVIFNLAELATALMEKIISPVIVRLFDRHISGTGTQDCIVSKMYGQCIYKWYGQFIHHQETKYANHPKSRTTEYKSIC